tara:strand:- start:695 stop:1300 length:606 start_codon:yes stop_codon:yes gene_type:complete
METKKNKIEINISTITEPPFPEGLQDFMRKEHEAQRIPVATTVQFDISELEMSVPAGLIFLQDAWAKAVIGTIAVLQDRVPAADASQHKMREVVSEHMADDGDDFFRYTTYIDLQLYKLREATFKKQDFASEVREGLMQLSAQIADHAWEYVHAHKSEIPKTIEYVNRVSGMPPEMLGGTSIHVVGEDEDEFDEDFVGEWG